MNGPEVHALHVPYSGDTHGLSRLVTVSRNCCSTALTLPSHVVPKLSSNRDASGRPLLRDGRWWVTRERGISRPPARFKASSPTRRDTHARPPSRSKPTPR